MSTEQKDYNLSPKEFARLVGVSSSTVRRWEEENVFTSVRTASGYRKFALSDVPKAKEYKGQVATTKKKKSQEHIYSMSAKQYTPEKNSHVAQFILKRAALISVSILVMIITAAAIATYPVLKGLIADELQAKNERRDSQHTNVKYPESGDVNVLAAESSRLARSIISNIGWNFRSKVQIEELQVNGNSVFLADIDAQGQNLNLGSGRITASNVLYGVVAGEGISIAGQTQIPLITNIDPGSAQEIFKNIKVGSNTITAESNTDTVTFEQGSGISLSIDGKKITIASTQSGYAYWSTEVDGVSYDNIEDGSSVNFVSGDDITVTRSAANELTFSLQDVIDTVTGIDLTTGGYLNGTNATITFDNFSVDASGNVRIAAGSDFYVGNVNLGNTGGTSGASLVGVDGTNISQSASGDLQTVLENMSAAMGSGSSKWTIASNVIYPNNYSTADFSLGGTTPSTSPFGIDIGQNILYLGDGINDANTPSIYFKASDGTNSGTLSYADSDRFVFSGGDVVVDGVIYAGSGVQQITLVNGLLNPSALPLITSGTSPTTNSVSGFEVLNNQIGLIRGCANGEVLKWSSGTARWSCSPDSSGVSGVIDVQEDGGIPSGSGDSQFDTLNFVNNFTLVENTSGVVDVDLAANIGIGTAPSGSYALTVNGATNTTTLYLSGTQVTANANEINLLSGRSGTLLDTVNASTQLSSWDQNASDDVTVFTGLTDTPANYSGQATKLVRVNAGGTGLEFVDASGVGTNYWGRNSGNGYVYPEVVADRLGVGNTSPTEMLDVTGNVAVSGTVDGRDISADGSNLDTLYTTIGLSALTSGEVDQLENIGSTTISSTQWGYLGSLNQSLSTTDAATFTTINTGQGAYELYAMDQNVRTSDTVQFAGLRIGGATPTLNSIVSGTGTDWSGAADTEVVTRLAIRSYVDAQVGGAAYTFENGLSESSNTVVFGGAISQVTRLYDGSYEYLYLNNSTGNLGIGTTSTGTYKLNVGGSLNISSLYLGGSQVTSTASELNLLDGVNLTLSAAEINLLDGRSGTLLDTANVATQLSAWDQNASDDLISSDIGTSVQGFNANTSFLGQTIESNEITNGTITSADLASTLSFASGVFIDLSSIDHGSTAPQGLRLPNATSANLAANSPSSGVGYLAYDTDLNKVKIFDGASWSDISGASTTLQQAYEAGNTILMTAADGNMRISNDGLNEILFLDEATGYVGIGNTLPGYKLDVSGAIRIAGGNDLYIGTVGVGSTAGAGLIGVDSTLIVNSASSILQTVLEDLDSAIGGVGSSSISAVGNISSGDAFTSGTPGSELYFTSAGVLGLGNTGSSAARIEFYNDTIDRISLLSSYVGVGTTSPVALLDVQGAIRLGASGGISDTLNTISAGTAPSASLYWGSYRICTTGDSCAGGDGGGVASTGAVGYLAKFTDQDNIENSILFETGGQIGIGKTNPSEVLDIVGDLAISGTVDGRDISTDGSNLDNLYTTIGLSALTSGEVDQLENIGATTISSTQWGYLGAMNQSVATTDAVTFTTINTGQGAYELYAMDQNVRTSDTVQFGGLQIGGATPTLSSIVSGTGTDWSGAADTEVVTRLAIRSYVDSQVTGSAQNIWSTISSDSGSTSANTTTDTLTINGSGSISTAISGDTLTITGTDNDTTYSAGSGLGLATTTFSLGGAISQPTRLYDGSYEYLYLNNSTGNVGIGTTSTGTYKLNVGGSFNTSNLYLAGSEVTSTAAELNLLDGVNLTLTAAEFNLLDGRSGTLLDTNNVATQLSAWDQDSSNDALITSLTSGYLPYFDGANLDDSSLYFTGGNIGIGTTNPSYKLDIANSTLTRGYNVVMDTSTIAFTYGGYIDITNSTGSATGQVVNVHPTAGQSSTGYRAEVSAGTSAYGVYINATSTNSFAIGTYSNAYAQSASSGDIYGGQFISESLGTSTAYGIYADAYASGTGQAWAGYFGSGNVYVENSIGVGTTNPQYALDVNGDIRIVSGSELYSYGSATLGNRTYTEDNFVTDGQTFTASIDALDQQVQDLANGEAGMWQDQTGYINPINATSFAITDTGRLGIGTTAPENPLSVVGNANFTGNVGIGTTEVGTYALNVNGNANVLGLYIGGSQVTSSATELNTLDGVNATLTSAELNYLDNATVTNGGIVFGNGSNFTQDAANFFWDDSSNYLGIGTTAPSATLDLFGTTAAFQMSYDASNYGKFTIGNDGTLTVAGVSAGGSLTNIARFSTTSVDIDVPTSFNATGDVSIANDLQFTNQTASYIKTLGPLTIEAGESYESNNLKLKTYNSGRVIFDAAGGAALNQAQNWDLVVSTTALNFENGLLNLDTTNSRIGIGTTTPSYALDIIGSTNIATGNTYKINGTDVLSGSTLGVGVTSSSLASVGTITSGTWQGSVVDEAYGGTGESTYAEGDLLIGNSSSGLSKLTVGGSGEILTSNGTAPVWQSLSAAGVVSGTGTSGYLPLWSGSSTLSNSAIYEAGGTIGIGTTAPASTLDVAGTGWIRGGTGNTGGLFVSSSGYVGIGTTSPSDVLEIVSSYIQAPKITITENLSSSTPFALTEYAFNNGTNLGRIAGQNINGASTFYLYGTAGRQIALGSNSSTTPHLLINTSGYVGIGTTNPTGKLEIVGSTDVSQFILTANATQSNTSPLITLQNSGGSELMRIHTDDATNLFFGYEAGENNDFDGFLLEGIGNTFIGYNSGNANTTGSLNTATGSFSFVNNTTGYNNTAYGYLALNVNTDGYHNTAFGAEALASNTTGTLNSAIGSRALNDNTEGDSNVALGFDSGRGITTGSGNTILGSGITGLASALTNNIILGSGGTTRAQFDGTNWNFTGNVGIGTTEVSTYALNVNGNANVLGLYIGGTQVNATATEINILSGATISTAELNYLDNSTVTNGGIVFGDGSNFTQDAANFFWDDSSNYLGIGTTAPSTSLELFGTTAGFQMSYDASNYGKFTIGSDGTLTLAGVSAGGTLTNIARFATTGIDIDVPTSFNATGDVSIANDLQFTNQTASYIKTLGPLTIESGELFENNNLTLKTYGTGNIVFDLTGTGSAWLTGTDTSLVFDTRTSTDTDYWLGIIDNANNTDDDLFSIGKGDVTGTSPLMTLNSSGYVGIGTTVPIAKLDVAGTGWIRGGTGNTTGLFVNSSGSVGIGTTNPIGELHIEDTASDALLYLKGGAGIDGSGVWSVSDNQSILRADTYDDSNESRVSLNRARGTAASPTALQAGDMIGAIEFNGYDTGLSDSAAIQVIASGEHGTAGDSTDAPGDMLFLTTPDGSGTLSERVRITSDGNMGIGTSAPVTGLDVATTAWLRGAAGGTGLYVNASSSVGIGTTNPSGLLQIAGSSLNSVFASTGYLGIGTTNAATPLEVFGTSAAFQLSYDASNYGKFTIGSDGTLTLAGVSAGGSLTNIARFSTSAVNIDVPTSFNAAGDVSVAYDLYFTNQTASYIKSDGPLSIVSGEAFESNDLSLETYGAGNIILKANSGNIWADGSLVGIGTTAPARALHVVVGSTAPPVRFQDSDGYCEINPTTTTWTCTSDATLKKDVETLSSIYNLEKLNQLRPVSFKWKTQNDEDRRFGLIAQEVEQLFPEFVQSDENGLKSVSYGSFTPILISAVQEQQLQIEGQQSSLTKLTDELALVVNEETGVVTSSLIDTLTEETENIADRTAAVEGDVEALAEKDSQIETRLITIEERLNALEQAQLRQDLDGLASASASLDTLNDRVGFLEQLFTGIQSTDSADLNTYLAELIEGQVLGLQTEEATLSALTVSGDTNVNNLGVTGEISSGLLTINGFDDTLATPAATISTLGGSLKLQHLGLGEIEFMAGKSKIDTDGNFIISDGDFVIETGVIKGNDQFRGIDISAGLGTTYLDIAFDTAKDTNEYAVNVTPSWLTNIAVINKRTDGFRIQFSTPAPLGGKVDWLIIE